jgi:multidrug resistance efflux pump
MSDEPAEADSGKSKDQAVSERSKNGALSDLRRITLVVIAIAVLIFIYFVIADRTTPFSGDARVQAFVLRVAPEINGHVKSVNVTDNEIVNPGELLVEIDPRPFEIAASQAQARLEQAGQNVGASTASVELAQARVEEARAKEANIRAQSSRVLELVKRGVYAKARKDDAVAKINAARAVVESAEADLRRAKQQLGTKGENNPQIRDALAALETARYNLSRTAITAPSRGVVTNLQLTAGQTVVAGQQVMTFISAEDVWLLGSMRENSLGVLKPGQPAEVVLDTLPGQIFSATLQSIGWGVGGGKVDPATGLPTSTDEAGWLTNPQRFPVQFVFDHEKLPKGARYGSRAAVIIYATGNPIMDAIAWIRIRMISLLTYVS